MKNLRTVCLISMFLLTSFLMFQPAVMATETRAGSMGGVGFYMRDNSNIFVFPGTFYQYSNQVVGELRVKNDNSLYSIGVHMPVSSMVLGVYLNSPLDLEIPAGVVTEVSLDRATDLFFATKLSGFDLGINLRVGMDQFSEDRNNGTDTVEYKETARFISIGAGLSNEKMDLALRLDLPAAETKFPASGTEQDLKYSLSGLGVGFNGRLWMEKRDKFQLVPLLVGYYATATRKQSPGFGLDTTYTTDYNRLNLAGGIGVNYQLNDENLLVLGLEVYGYAKDGEEVKNDYKSSITTTTMPGVYLGLESKISKWLIGRLGAVQVFQSEKTTYKPEGGKETQTTSYSSQFKMTFGLGFTFGNFVLDAAFNEGLLFDGPYFISGSAEPIANRLSITYNF
jgi:hypothetical protein